MSCRTTKGGSAATTLARRASGLPDGEITRLFHALQRQASDAAPPRRGEVTAWANNQQWAAKEIESVRERESLQDRLRYAGFEKPAGPTFIAWQSLKEAAKARAYGMSVKDAVFAGLARSASYDRVDPAGPLDQRPPKVLDGPVPDPPSSWETEAWPENLDDEQLSEVRDPRGIEDRDLSWTRWGPDFVQVLSADTHSGWKLHVASDGAEQTEQAAQAVYKVARDRGIGMKIATANLTSKPQPDGQMSVQATKGVTLYLPRRQTVDEDTTAVVRALESSGYTTRASVAGSTEKHVRGAVWSRWELDRDPGRDVPTREAIDRYAAAVHTP